MRRFKGAEAEIKLKEFEQEFLIRERRDGGSN